MRARAQSAGKFQNLKLKTQVLQGGPTNLDFLLFFMKQEIFLDWSIQDDQKCLNGKLFL